MHSITRDEIRNILVIRLNKIGDMICTIPLLRTLRHNFKNARISVLTEKSPAEILTDSSLADDLIIYTRKSSRFANRYLEVWKVLRDYKRKSDVKFDIAIGVKGGFSSFLAAITFLSRATLRIGYSDSQRHPLTLCYNLPVKPIDVPNVHQVDACLNLLTAIGIKDITKDITIDIPPEIKDSTLRFLYSKGLQPKDKLIVFNISNNRETSKWQLSKFVELGKILIKKYNYRCIITSVESDRDNAIKLCEELNGGCFFYKTEKLMDFAAITSMANILVAGDGGAIHIGATAGTPVVALFGEINPIIWGPYGKQHIVLTAPDGDVKSIKVEDVLNAIESKGLLV